MHFEVSLLELAMKLVIDPSKLTSSIMHIESYIHCINLSYRYDKNKNITDDCVANVKYDLTSGI